MERVDVPCGPKREPPHVVSRQTGGVENGGVVALGVRFALPTTDWRCHASIGWERALGCLAEVKPVGVGVMEGFSTIGATMVRSGCPKERHTVLAIGSNQDKEWYDREYMLHQVFVVVEGWCEETPITGPSDAV